MVRKSYLCRLSFKTTKKQQNKKVGRFLLTKQESQLFHTIPDDLMHTMFEYLNSRETRRISLVCSRWKTIVTLVVYEAHLRWFAGLNFVTSKEYSQWMAGTYTKYVSEAKEIDNIGGYDIYSYYRPYRIYFIDCRILRVFELKYYQNVDIEDDDFLMLSCMTEVDKDYDKYFKRDLAAALPDIVMSDSDLEYPYEGHNDVEDEHFPEHERIVFCELIKSINFFKSKVFIFHCSNDGEYEFYFKMSNNDVWRFHSTTLNEKRYNSSLE